MTTSARTELAAEAARLHREVSALAARVESEVDVVLAFQVRRAAENLDGLVDHLEGIEVDA